MDGAIIVVATDGLMPCTPGKHILLARRRRAHRRPRNKVTVGRPRNCSNCRNGSPRTAELTVTRAMQKLLSAVLSVSNQIALIPDAQCVLELLAVCDSATSRIRSAKPTSPFLMPIEDVFSIPVAVPWSPVAGTWHHWKVGEEVEIVGYPSHRKTTAPASKCSASRSIRARLATTRRSARRHEA